MKKFSFHIRPAMLDDADSIAEAHMHSINTLGLQCYSPEIVAAWGEYRDGTRYREAMKSESLFVAENSHDAKCLGFSALRKENDVWRIAVYVRGDAIRHGVGKNLFNTAESLARTKGAEFLMLDASLIAVSFYKSCGFHELETGFHRLANGLIMECVKMRKDLS